MISSGPRSPCKEQSGMVYSCDRIPGKQRWVYLQTLWLPIYLINELQANKRYYVRTTTTTTKVEKQLKETWCLLLADMSVQVRTVMYTYSGLVSERVSSAHLKLFRWRPTWLFMHRCMKYFLNILCSIIHYAFCLIKQPSNDETCSNITL